MDTRDDLIAILSYRRGAPRRSEAYTLSEEEWSMWADRLYASARLQARKGKGGGVKLVSAWLSIRAAHRGWMDLFSKWGKRASEAGLSTEDLNTPLFERLYTSLSKEERLRSSSTYFLKEHERVMGYPFRLEVF
tara:strand:+ start:2899 stop:3300 length:402 start_codon:yes stop_codon:yes gene_type:complete